MPLLITRNIPLGVLAPGDSINMLNTPLIGVSAIISTAGDNIVIIWPSSTQTIVPDTSITSLYVINSIASIHQFDTI